MKIREFHFSGPGSRNFEAKPSQKRHHLILYRLDLLRDSVIMLISLVARTRAVLSPATRVVSSMDTCLGTNLRL